MLHFFAEYGLFLAKTATIVIAVLIIMTALIALTVRSKGKSKEKIEITKLNKKYADMKTRINRAILGKAEQKRSAKELKAQKKVEKRAAKKGKEKNTAPQPKKSRVFVVNFKGDIKASEVDSLREVVTAILTVATPADEVVAN
jgi:serine protease SohB